MVAFADRSAVHSIAFEKFRVNDRVSHKTLGHGTVTRNSGEYIVVQYHGVVGEYDLGWFNRNPDVLFHRRKR